MSVLYLSTVLLLTIPEFLALTCPRLKIDNGFTKMHARGQVMRFFCNKGFRRYGNARAKCKLTGWSKSPPICLAPGCSPYSSLTNGNITYLWRSRMLFRCHEGYILKGFSEIYCNGTSWSAPLPECKVPADIEVCDFEYEHFCGWSQDNKDDFDWIWHKGQTPTGWTGPQYDHTYLNEKGHYLYLEMSPPRMRGDVARLISPKYGSNKSGKCFSYWYHMLGPKEPNEVGSIRVILKHLLTDENTTLLEIHGNQGNLWKFVEVYIEKTNGSFQIIIEGTREKSYVGDIAVDDFKFYNCTVQETTTSPFETTLTTTNDVETTHDQGTSIADVQTIDTKDPFSKISPVTSRVKITTTSPPTSTPSTFSLTVANRSISTDSKYQKTTNIMMKTKKFSNNEIQNKNQFTTEHNMNLTKSERTTLGFILTSNKNGNLLTLGVTGSTSKTILDTNRKDIPSKSIVTGSGYTSTLKSTGNGSSTHSMSGRQGKFHYARLMTVSTSSSQQNYTKNNLKAGDLSEHLIQNTTLIMVISVCTICFTAIVLIIIIFICRKRKSQDDDPLEEMKTHFVYKKSVDFTLSRENMTEDVCNQGFGLPVRDLL